MYLLNEKVHYWRSVKINKDIYRLYYSNENKLEMIVRINKFC